MRTQSARVPVLALAPFLAVAALSLSASGTPPADAGKPEKIPDDPAGKPGKKPKAAEKRELLAEHKTVARFLKVEEHTCRGLTGLCPDRCGSSGPYARFEVVSYVAYKKHGQYGDDKAADFRVQIADNLKNPKAPAAIAEAVSGLKPGDLVRLDWNHDYVTKDGSSSPERPVVKLEKLTEEEAGKLLKGGAGKPGKP